MTDTVIREVCKDIWTFSKPFARGGIVPIGGRSTAVRLQTGGLWVLASTPLDKETKTKLDELGPVEFIISPDKVHHLFISDFKNAYPNAKVIMPADAIQRHGNKDLKVDGVWGKDPENTKYGFEDDIQHLYFSGFANKDVAFLHAASKTLIEADLVFNLPATEQYSKSKTSGKIPIFGGVSPHGKAAASFSWIMGKDQEAMKRDAKVVAGWDFERIIPCHGDVIEKTGKQAWLDSYRHYLA